MKHRQTDTHVYFVGVPFTQWLNSTFEARLVRDGPNMTFNCCEQYMMSGKAALFGDEATLARIMAEQATGDRHWFEVPKAQKRLGGQVTPFEEERWTAERSAIVERANLAKFTQDLDLQAALHGTGDRVIVEGAWYDRIWGVGLAWDDPLIEDQANWRGLNLLGQALMRTRARIVQAIASGVDPISLDPFEVVR